MLLQLQKRVVPSAATSLVPKTSLAGSSWCSACAEEPCCEPVQEQGANPGSGSGGVSSPGELREELEVPRSLTPRCCVLCVRKSCSLEDALVALGPTVLFLGADSRCSHLGAARSQRERAGGGLSCGRGRGPGWFCRGCSVPGHGAAAQQEGAPTPCMMPIAQAAGTARRRDFGDRGWVSPGTKWGSGDAVSTLPPTPGCPPLVPRRRPAQRGRFYLFCRYKWSCQARSAPRRDRLREPGPLEQSSLVCQSRLTLPIMARWMRL